jgi:DNA-binding response OmpR family regulator
MEPATQTPARARPNGASRHAEKTRVLVVEDEKDIAGLIKHTLERVWGYDRLIETRSVDVHVGRLRGKLGAVGKQIETVVGLGYRFIETNK